MNWSRRRSWLIGSLGPGEPWLAGWYWGLPFSGIFIVPVMSRMGVWRGVLIGTGL
jgi:hypothetical protein